MSTAKKSIKGASKSEATKPGNATKARELVYGVHKEGSRKGKVHELFNKEGPEAAWVLGLKLKLRTHCEVGSLRGSDFRVIAKTRSRPIRVRRLLSNRMTFRQPVKPRTRKQILFPARQY
jgi:hypothetical protein